MAGDGEIKMMEARFADCQGLSVHATPRARFPAQRKDAALSYLLASHQTH